MQTLRYDFYGVLSDLRAKKAVCIWSKMNGYSMLNLRNTIIDRIGELTPAQLSETRSAHIGCGHNLYASGSVMEVRRRGENSTPCYMPKMSAAEEDPNMFFGKVLKAAVNGVIMLRAELWHPIWLAQILASRVESSAVLGFVRPCACNVVPCECDALAITSHVKRSVEASEMFDVCYIIEE